MRKLLSSCIVLALVLIIGGCGKDPEPTQQEMLTAASSGWITTALTVQAPGGTSQDAFAQYEACDKDDAIVFMADGTYRVDNPLKCETSEPAILESGTWSISSDKTKIQFKPTGDSAYDLTIIELIPTQLKGTITIAIGTTPYTGTITVKPK